jgi:hypothetical protein
MDILKILGWVINIGGALFVLTAFLNWGDGEYITALIMGLVALVVGFILSRDVPTTITEGEADNANIKSGLFPELNYLKHPDPEIQNVADLIDSCILKFDMTDNMTAENTNARILEIEQALLVLDGSSDQQKYYVQFQDQLQAIKGNIRYGNTEDRRYGPRDSDWR